MRASSQRENDFEKRDVGFIPEHFHSSSDSTLKKNGFEVLIANFRFKTWKQGCTTRGISVISVYGQSKVCRSVSGQAALNVGDPSPRCLCPVAKPLRWRRSGSKSPSGRDATSRMSHGTTPVVMTKESIHRVQPARV